MRDEAVALHERITTDGYMEQDEDVLTVYELVEGLQDVLIGYQVSSDPKKLITKSLKLGNLGGQCSNRHCMIRTVHRFLLQV